MTIDFKFETDDIESDWAAPVVSRRHVAKIIFSVGPYKVTYMGESYYEEIEAARGAVQAFLDGEIYDRSVSAERKLDNGSIEFGPMSPEIKNIIEQAIDLKTGKDRNKLMESFQ